ncbi:tRNA pseudouridine(38-40) synthase TruA [Pseudothauera lacus]|uniref:tRNA pseudouridine synthase A n=1 Tax=Pseudothauera lacus TaxID=2136175 RepID=A0A2T4II47_9RHOO|nr:tRNA pseudouridine(38-40) synthase TruA [Pseudothauera lacus]PTD97437.1 tRNA pseudouridine(38-40) synthase TruA [Pseudothauera lacus]
MVRVALGVEYAGDAFLGWQSQQHGHTVQDALETALAQICAHPVRLHCAGRTDAGVHATAQVAHFDTSARRPPGAWVRGVNALLPAAVVVRWGVEVDEHFHARYCASGRRYRYILHNAAVRPALLAGRVGWYHRPLDVDAMAVAAALLVGEHDFSAFRAAGCQARTPVRLMYDARVVRHGDYVVFDFHANGFLHHMIRNLVGTLCYIGNGRRPVAWMAELLDSRDRRQAAPTFSADGLYLCGVDYPPNWPLPDEGRIIALPRIPLI